MNIVQSAFERWTLDRQILQFQDDNNVNKVNSVHNINNENNVNNANHLRSKTIFLRSQKAENDGNQVLLFQAQAPPQGDLG